MAKLPLSRAEAAELAQTLPVGTSLQGYTLASRVQHPVGDGDHHWTVTVTKGPNTWVCEYLVHPTPPYGRILQIEDEDGRVWSVDAIADDWHDEGIG